MSRKVVEKNHECSGKTSHEARCQLPIELALSWYTRFEPLRSRSGFSPPSKCHVHYDLTENGKTEKIEETYLFRVGSIFSQVQSITNVSHYSSNVHVSDKAIYSGGDQQVDFKKEQEREDGLPKPQTRIYLFKKRTRTILEEQKEKEPELIEQFKPAKYAALRFNTVTGCQLILDVRHADCGPFTFGRKVPRGNPAEVLFQSYIPPDAPYTYFTNKDKTGRKFRLSGFSSKQFKVDVGSSSYVFTPLSEVNPKRFKILDADFKSTDFVAGVFKKGIATPELRQMKFAVMEFRASTESKANLSPLQLEFDMRIKRQTALKPDVKGIAGEGSALILKRLSHPENENRGKLKTVIFNNWTNLDELFRIPFVIMWKEGLYLVPRGNQEVCIHFDGKKEVVKNKEPLPLAHGLAYRVGEFFVSVGALP
ncbi:MAG: hypothetical protein CR997_11625 [Acidobacteria bacterium]|nr:MAG: hypothetical protein CR997_11625 [Acidobacteriota bacterium]